MNDNKTPESRASTMIVAYIAHPVSAKTEEEKNENLALIAEIFREISLTEPDTIPFVPYYIACHALHEDVSQERTIGLKGNAELMSRDFVDEVRLYGDRISKGMSHEIVIAMMRGILIRPMTPETMREFQQTFAHVKNAADVL